MFEVIRDWFATDIITVLNTTVSTALSETDRDLDTELLPAGQKDYHYTLQIGDVEELNLEAEQYRVSCVCKLSFIANTKDVSNYETYLDDYVFPIVRLLKRYSTGIDTSGISFNEVELGSIKANLNVFEDNYFKPQIEFTVKVIDSVDMSLSVPSAPTLTSPANGSTSGLTDQSFNWTGTADTWNFVLLNGTTEVINQDGLLASSFTIPADSLLTDGTTYTWKVRGKNEAGYGSFSSVYSFTVSDDPLPVTPVLDDPANGATETGLTVLFTWAGSLRATSYEIQIATDSGFSSLVTTVTGLTATYYEYTFASDNTYYWRVRATNDSGSSAYTSGRSVIVDAPVADYRTGLVAEWVADTGVTSNENGVSAWVDTIASLSATQSTTSNKPYYAAGAINGKSAIRFFGASNHQWLSFASLALTNYTIIVVYKATSFRAGDSNYFFGGSSQGLFSSINALSIGYGEFDGTRIRAVTYNAADTNWNIRSFQNTKLYSNGVEATYSNTQNMTGLTLTTIGTRGDNTSLSFKGEIACIRVYNSELSTTNRAQAESYLNSIYAVY